MQGREFCANGLRGPLGVDFLRAVGGGRASSRPAGWCGCPLGGHMVLLAGRPCPAGVAAGPGGSGRGTVFGKLWVGGL